MDTETTVHGKHWHTVRAFTLIELLVVVAIVAILASIAVPNYLEAQTRAKTARVKADARTIATAIESYLTDNNARLFRTTRVYSETREYLLHPLTTPIPYLSVVPRDPFNTVDAREADRVMVLCGPDYLEGDPENPTALNRSATYLSPYPEYSDGSTLVRRKFWVLFSLGPNLLYEIYNPVFPSPMVPYDPTNGTVSKGDIVRFQN